MDSISLSTRQSIAPLVLFHSNYKKSKNNGDIIDGSREKVNKVPCNDIQKQLNMYNSPRTWTWTNNDKSPSPVLRSVNESKETDLKLKLLQNRIKNLHKAELRARWRIQDTAKQGELFQKRRQQKFEHSQVLNQSMRNRESDHNKSKIRVTEMRKQIIESINRQRNNVFSNNRKLKEDVISNLRTLKKRKQSEDQFQHESDQKKNYVINQSKTNAMTNKGMNMFAVRAEAKKRNDEKVEINTKTSEGNMKKIK
jgi:hypothetical protein